MTPKIQPLPAELIALIAAGEIAERPAVIVKELIENALDAGATEIQIEVYGSGLEKILVHDNGQGMSQADLQLAYQRHTTSKIHDLADLSRLSTFGFRGEALASISQIGTLTLQSRPANQTAGFMVTVTHLQATDPVPMGMPVGTTVIVEDLFRSLPARKKFLKSKTNELRLITQSVLLSSLSHPSVKLSLRHDQQLLFQVSSHQTLAERTLYVLGLPDGQTLLPIETTRDSLAISGFIGTPQVARKTTSHQYLFINQRPVQHSPINQAIKNALGTLLEPRLQPVFMLQLQLPPDQVDVNIHPRKETVAFINEPQILKVLSESIHQALQTYDLSYQAAAEPASTSSETLYNPQNFKTTKSLLRDSVPVWQPGSLETGSQVAQLHQTYLVVETKAGVTLIDQHAAHERILYEEFAAALQNHSHDSVTLPEPLLLQLSPTDSLILEEYQSELSALGFVIETFGPQTFHISAIPTALSQRHLPTVIKQVLDDLQTGQSLVSVQHKVLAFLACRGAVKAGDFLTPEQRLSLLKKLDQTPNRFTCPHGRPTMIKLSLQDLERLFKRRK